MLPLFLLLGYCNHYKSVTSHYEKKQNKGTKYDLKWRHSWCTDNWCTIIMAKKYSSELRGKVGVNDTGW